MCPGQGWVDGSACRRRRGEGVGYRGHLLGGASPLSIVSHTLWMTSRRHDVLLLSPSSASLPCLFGRFSFSHTANTLSNSPLALTSIVCPLQFARRRQRHPDEATGRMLIKFVSKKMEDGQGKTSAYSIPSTRRTGARKTESRKDGRKEGI